MLTLRPIGQNDYNVREAGQTIGRIRYAGERMPGAWLWNIQVHLTGGLTNLEDTSYRAVPQCCDGVALGASNKVTR